MVTLDKDWIQDRLNILTDYSDELYEVDPDATTSYRPMTALKLSLLSAGLNIYSQVAMQRFDHCHYVDLLSGAGLTQLTGRDDYVIGSALLAPAMTARDPFEEYHFVEEDQSRADALGKRLDLLDENLDPFPRDRCSIYIGDANNEVDTIRNSIREGGVRGVNLFTFIDNEQPDIHWDTIEVISEFFGDLLITFPTTSINRRSGIGSDKQKGLLNDFYGTNEWQNCESESEFRELYQSRLSEAGSGKPIQEYVSISSGQSGGRFYYDMIWATRETKGESPYSDAVEYMKKRIERLDGDDVGDVLDYFVHGNQTSLDLFPDSTSEGRDKDQSGLDRFL